jgi:hypothetical protein
MHGHQLHGFLALAGLMLAGLERGVREKGGERPAIRDRLAVTRRIALVVQESGRRVDQFVEVLQPVLAFLVGQIVLAQAAFRSRARSLRAAAGRCVSLRRASISRMKAGDRLAGLAGQARGGVVQARIGRCALPAAPRCCACRCRGSEN